MWAATSLLHSLNIYRALPEAWLYVKGWQRPGPALLRLKMQQGEQHAGGEVALKSMVSDITEMARMLKAQREKTKTLMGVSRGHETYYK